MMIRKIVFCLSLFLMVFTAAAEPLVLTDALGRQVELSGTPGRVVLAGRAVIMLMDAVYMFPRGQESVVAVGFTNQGRGDFFPLVEEDVHGVSSLKKNAGAEEIAARNPDLVILKTFMRSSVGETLEKLDIPVLYLDLETPEKYARDIRTLGTLFGESARAEEILSLNSRRLGAMQTDRGDKPNVLMLYINSSEGEYSFSVSPREWIQGRMVEMAGGVPLWEADVLSPGWNQVTFEQVAAWDADIITLVSYRQNAADMAEELKDDPLWSSLRAIREGRLYAVPADFYSWGQPDTRWILGTQWLNLIFNGPDGAEGREEARRLVLDFFGDYYGFSAEKTRERILPVIEGSLF